MRNNHTEDFSEFDAGCVCVLSPRTEGDRVGTTPIISGRVRCRVLTCGRAPVVVPVCVVPRGEAVGICGA